jgi:DNA-binding LacI/PurR family transcriptional regulator
MKTQKTHQYLRVMGDLQKKIHAGKWKEGNYIPTEKEICKTYAVSGITARRALDELELKGYIKRQRAKGNLLISRIANVVQEFVCIVTKQEEHLYIPLAQRIIVGLQRHDYQVVTHPIGVVLENPEATARFPTSARALIIEGGTPDTAERVRNIMRNIEFSVLVIPDTPGNEHFSASIESDLFHGGYIAARHCADCGYKRIVYFTYPIDPEQYWAISVRHHYEGMQEACREKDVELLLRDIADGRHAQASNGIAEMLAKLGKGCAILSNTDFLASHVYRVAQNLGWRIPEDLGLVGYSNTPWSISLDMTTVDIQIDVIARQTVKVVQEQRRGTIVVPPILIARGSTCAASS